MTLGNTSNFVGSSLGFGNGIVAGTFDLGLRSDVLNFAGTVSGSGNATLSPLTQGATIGVAGGAGTYQVSQATLDSFASFTSITVGRADGTGDLTFGNLVLPTSLSALSSSGDVGFTGTRGECGRPGAQPRRHHRRHDHLRRRGRRRDRRNRGARQPERHRRHPAERQHHRQRQRVARRAGHGRRGRDGFRRRRRARQHPRHRHPCAHRPQPIP